VVGEALALPEQRGERLAIAEEMFRGALQIDPACARARLGLAVVHVLRGEAGAAVRQIRAAERDESRVVREYAGLIERSPLLLEAFAGQGIRVHSGDFEFAEAPP
jgi:lipopolysaccharide biosynthesis regulator YciM